MDCEPRTSKPEQTTTASTKFKRRKKDKSKAPKKKAKAVAKPRKVVFNVANSKYPIIRKATGIGREMEWRVSATEDGGEWDVCWSDLGIPSEKLQKMREWQRINHFPAMYLICRKNLLAKHLKVMETVFPQHYDFAPKTWVLPYEFTDLKQYFGQKKVLSMIVKPVASCQGRGIYLTK